MNDEQKNIVSGKIARLMRENRSLLLGAITVKKENVKPHIREDGNKLYNYMIGLSILDNIKDLTDVEMIRDKRSVKVKSGNSCIDYLNIKLAFDLDSATKLIDIPTESHTELNLIFIDWVANFVWSSYEDNKNEPFNRLKESLKIKELFFN